MRQPSFPKVEPHFSSRRGVELVHPAARFDVPHAQHRTETGSIGGWGGRMGDEMVMIGKHRPRLQLPAELFRHRQQAAMQNPQPFRAAKVVSLLIRRARDEVSAALRELVGGGVRPRCLGFRHERKMPLAGGQVKRKV